MKYQSAYSYCDVMKYALQSDFPENIDMIYIGSYFCDRYFCGTTKQCWEDVIHKADAAGLPVVLVIPTPSQSRMESLKSAVIYLLSHYKESICEIVVNDIAMLKFVSEHTKLKIWCGRTMSKDIRDPRYGSDNQRTKLYDHACSGKGRLFGNNVYGVEVDVVNPQLITSCGSVMLGIHIPLAYMTFGRHCEIGSSDMPLENKFRLDKECGRQCEKNWLSYSDGAFIKFGRTVYFDNSSSEKGITIGPNTRLIRNAIADMIGRKPI